MIFITTLRKITADDIRYTTIFYHDKKAKHIAEELGLTLNQVYEIAKKQRLTRKQNKEVVMSTIMEQIILSGILGDGRLKKNGKYNYYYSECHALGEKEYLKWKFDNLEDLTKTSSIYPKNENNNSCDAVEFTTLTTPTLIPYAKMKKIEVINQLNDLGILLFMLDDGWTKAYKDRKGICISGGELTKEELECFINRCFYVIGAKGKITGKKRYDVSFSCTEEPLFLHIIKKYHLEHIDVVQKKFGK